MAFRACEARPFLPFRVSVPLERPIAPSPTPPHQTGRDHFGHPAFRPRSPGGMRKTRTTAAPPWPPDTASSGVLAPGHACVEPSRQSRSASSRESVAKAGALCSGRITALRRSYGPLRLPTQAPLGISASGLISSVPTARAGGPGGVSSLTPLFCPCMLPPSPRESRRVRPPDSSPADTSLRLTTGGSATPLPALAAIAAGYTLTGLIGRSRLLRPAGLSPSLGCVRPHLAVEPSRTLCRSCFDGASCPATPGPRLLGRIGAFPRRAPFIPLEQRLRPRTVVGIARVLDVRVRAVRA